MEFSLTAIRIDASGSTATAKSAQLILDTSVAGRQDALNPVELLLASQAACFIKGIERIAPQLGFAFESVEVTLKAERPDLEARLETISYDIRIRTTEPDNRIELLHKNLKKQGTIYNTLSKGTKLSGTVTAAS